MHITDPSQLGIGMEVYEVCSFGQMQHTCHIYRYAVLQIGLKCSQGKPTFMETKQLAFDCGSTGLGLNPNGTWDGRVTWRAGRIDNKSMQDCGIIPNTYNKHQTFTSLAEAKLFAENGTLSISDLVAEAPEPEEARDYDRAMNVVNW